MKLAVIGISHKELAIDARSSFSFTDSQKLEFASLLLEHHIEQCIILSTCNRSEVYIMSDDDTHLLKGLYKIFVMNPHSFMYIKVKKLFFICCE